MKEETLRQKQIFDIYYSLGDKRSLEKLKENLKNTPEYSEKTPSLDTLKSWSKKFNWQERIQQRDAEISKGLEKKINQDIVNEKAEHRKLIKAILNELKRSLIEYQNEIKEGIKPAQIETIKDLKDISQIIDTLIKLDLNILGEPLTQSVNLIISEKYLPSDE
ncbi:MAG TPA: hypothetical protein PKJ39_06215 [Caldisericia bacterium]|nr:hypothetical protein [Caldisericia bacterium]